MQPSGLLFQPEIQNGNGDTVTMTLEEDYVRKLDETIPEGSSSAMHGVPVFPYITERDGKFTSHFWKSLHKALAHWPRDHPRDNRENSSNQETYPSRHEIAKRALPMSEKTAELQIIARVGTVAYRLELPERLNRVHSMFHVSKLKKCMADEPLAIPLDEIQVDDKLNFIEEPVEISGGTWDVNAS
ncbi:hypothetical protein Tco_1563090 [Tanacetum coccineum]